MASPIQADNQTWKPSAGASSPTSLAGSAPTSQPATSNTTIEQRPEDSNSGEIGETDRPLISTSGDEAARAGQTGFPHGEDVPVSNHANSHPIDVPQSPSAKSFDQMTVTHMSGEPLSSETSLLEEFMKNRRPSIAFHPIVTLESGHQRGLEEPLPKLAINTKTRRASLLSESRHPSRFVLNRVQSEADCRNYDLSTGEPCARSQVQNIDDLTFGDSKEGFNFPKIPPTLNEVPEQRTSSDSEQGVSLTSDSTASPLISEVQTPTETMEMLLSPISTFPPVPYPHSFEDSSAWPKLRRQTSGPRAKSYEIEPGFSMRAVNRQNSRASTRRSTSSSMSPATAFLSRFARQESPPDPDSEGQEVGEYVLGKQIGFGGFSAVREAFTIEGEERICRAVKIVRRQIVGREEMENERLQAEFDHEVSLWRCLGHRNILPLIEVYESDFATFCFTKLNTGGTLFDVVRANRQGLGRDLARRYAYQLASAIRYLHEDVRIVHRDIKLENCLVDVSDPDAAREGGNVLLCDFGLAEFASHDTGRGSPDPYDRASARTPPLPLPTNPNPSEASVSIAGSLQYASPELIVSPAGFLSSVVDVWAFGVVMYALLVGDLPFQHTFQPKVQMMILAGEWDSTALEKAPGVVGFEDEVQELMHGCLDMNSESRWSISQVLDCQWLKGCQEMLEEMNESIKL